MLSQCPAAFKCCGQGKRERKRMCSSNFISVPLETLPPQFFFNLEIYSRAICSLFFSKKLFIHKMQIHVAWDILQIHVELFLISLTSKSLAENGLCIFNRICLYLKYQFCKPGENSVTPAISSSVETVCNPTDGFLKGCSRRATSPSWLRHRHSRVM